MPVPALVTLVSWAIAEKLASNELTLSPEAAADAEAVADSEAGADVAGTGGPVAVALTLGDGDAPDEHPGTRAATATIEGASWVALTTPHPLNSETPRRWQRARPIWP